MFAPSVRRTCVWSPPEPDGRHLYRYRLVIVWDSALPMLVVVFLNPSTADEEINDPTVTRTIERARRMGCGGLVVLNAFAWRETDRLKMLKVADPVGPMNDFNIRDQLVQAKAQGWPVIVGWGNEGCHRDRHLEIHKIFDDVGLQAMCLRVNKLTGQPGHPLYIGYDQPLIPWRP